MTLQDEIYSTDYLMSFKIKALYFNLFYSSEYTQYMNFVLLTNPLSLVLWVMFGAHFTYPDPGVVTTASIVNFSYENSIVIYKL